jgi:hypothetical protein
MSGGRFDYNQYRIRDIADDIEQEIKRSGKPLTKQEMKDYSWRGSDWYERYPEDKFHYKYPDEVIKEFERGYYILRLAEIYAQRIDWLLSGDDGDESFILRLYNEKQELKKEYHDRQADSTRAD